MKRLAAALLVLASIAAAQTARDIAWRSDLDYLAGQLPQRHPNLFYVTPRSVFSEAVAALRNEIPSLNDTAVMVRLAEIVALAHDAHTALSLNQRRSSFRRLPLDFQWFEDGLFVTGASPGYARAAGTKVLRIGNRTADEAYDAIKRITSYENDAWARAYGLSYFGYADVLQALGITDAADTVPFEFQDPSGARFTLAVASAEQGTTPEIVPNPDPSAGFQPLYQQNRSQDYWFTYIESSRTLYFAYNACREMAGLPFTRFNDQLWASFDSHPVERFIIDLRNNEGGSSSVIYPFLASGIARVQRLENVRVSLILGRHTFSSGVLNAISLHSGPVIAYGEPTGGSTSGYGEVQSFTLPNSQLVVWYSTKYFSSPLPPGSLMPDVPVAVSSADYFARHDPVLAAILADTRDAPAASGTMTVVNGASFRGPATPGAIAAVFGDWPDPAGAPVEVTVNGVAAIVLAAARGQVNFVVPAAIAPGLAAFRVAQAGATLAEGTATIAAGAPGLFAASVQNGVLQIYGTGLSEDARVYVGSDRTDLWAVAADPAAPGLWQISAQPPAGAIRETAVFITTGNRASNAAKVKIEQ